jgi:hypothetical protein
MPRSTAIEPPLPMAVDIEPKIPRLTIRYAVADTPAISCPLLSPPKTSSRIAGISMLKISTRRFRSSRRISIRR